MSHHFNLFATILSYLDFARDLYYLLLSIMPIQCYQIVLGACCLGHIVESLYSLLNVESINLSFGLVFNPSLSRKKSSSCALSHYLVNFDVGFWTNWPLIHAGSYKKGPNWFFFFLFHDESSFQLCQDKIWKQKTKFFLKRNVNPRIIFNLQ